MSTGELDGLRSEAFHRRLRRCGATQHVAGALHKFKEVGGASWWGRGAKATQGGARKRDVDAVAKAITKSL